MDPAVVERLPVRGHTIVLIVSFIWPLTFAFMKSSSCVEATWIFTTLFGLPLLCAISVLFKHNKCTRNTFGYVLMFGAGLLGWFMFPLVAVNCKSNQAWYIFGIYTPFCLLSGARFVKFYDTRHPEEEKKLISSETEKSRVNTENSSHDFDSDKLLNSIPKAVE